MKKITSLIELHQALEQRVDFVHVVGGREYQLSYIRLLHMKLLDIIVMIGDGILFYNPEN